jgi:ATP-dependent helicase/nuclease subunit A
MNLTAAQQEAIAARGNVLVVAGAGTGKTSTLVERCLNCVLEEKPRASLDEILMVTFTDAAAAEMRQRIRQRLEEEMEKRKSNPTESDVLRHLREQLALFEAAHIGTLHSFCLQLVRQHFYQLELDPQLTVMPEEEAQLLANETIETVLQKHYGGRSRNAAAVQQLIEAQARGRDQTIRSLLLKLHHYSQTRPDPAAWLAAQTAMFAAAAPDLWKSWLRQAIADWPGRWRPLLGQLAGENEVAGTSLGAVRRLEQSLGGDESRWQEEGAKALQEISAAGEACPYGKKTAWLQPLKEFLDETDFLLSVVAGEGKRDPLTEDWSWVRSQMQTLLEIAREFTEAFTEAKRELGAVDFHDLEQYALRLLWDGTSGQLTGIARDWRRRLRFVFVDEYQDINAAQDRIIEGLSRESGQANRFLVGDVKQSIYRFRLADPKIFQNYAETWRQGSSKVIPLVENFRSREGILSFVNSMFGLLMHRETGGVEYDEEAQLQFGASGERSPAGAAPDAAPCVELHLRLKRSPVVNGEEAENGALGQVAELEDADKEARLVARRLWELEAAKCPIWDPHSKSWRPAAWSDMAVLLRSPSNKAESYAKQFSALNVPLQAARGGFYESIEISDLLSLLQVLDNPLQDLPLLALLHSPLVGLTADELADIRLAAQGPFWTALVRWKETGESGSEGRGKGKRRSLETQYAQPELPLTESRTQVSPAETWRKVAVFLKRFARWRRLARQESLSRSLEAVLSETHYADWLLTRQRGQQRQANVQGLLGLARQFDEFQRQGLFRFLRFIEAQQTAETEPEVAPVSEANAVRLMSIHQSKGLEFPVVVVADLGKSFNMADLRAEVILDEEYGLCPQIKPPTAGMRYPSLPYWLARQRQHREMLGEELRLLYVAMTRARDLLILSGSVPERRLDGDWISETQVEPERLLKASGYADWLGAWFAQNVARESGAREGKNDSLSWRIHDDSDLLEAEAAPGAAKRTAEASWGDEPVIWQKLRERLAWSYPFVAATERPAKTSVTALRRRAAELEDEDALQIFAVARRKAVASRAQSSLGSRLSTADVGSVHHTFLEQLSLEQARSKEGLKLEAQRLEQEGVLSAEECALLDLEGIAAFWDSELGRKVHAQAAFVRRELAFTARFPATEIARIIGEPPEATLESEFVVVQGVADLAVMMPLEIWLIDFKTDVVTSAGLADKAKMYDPQLKLYTRALSRIYRRPVTQCWLYFLAGRAAVAIEPAAGG